MYQTLENTRSAREHALHQCALVTTCGGNLYYNVIRCCSSTSPLWLWIKTHNVSSKSPLSVQAMLELVQPYAPSLQWQGNAFFMDLILASGKFKLYEIRYIDIVCLYLQIITTLDMAHTDGRYLDGSIKQGSPSLLSSHTRWIHCHQEKPTCPSVWSMWSRTCFVVATKTGKLQNPLGKWLHKPAQLRRAWPACFIQCASNPLQ